MAGLQACEEVAGPLVPSGGPLQPGLAKLVLDLVRGGGRGLRVGVRVRVRVRVRVGGWGQARIGVRAWGRVGAGPLPLRSKT